MKTIKGCVCDKTNYKIGITTPNKVYNSKWNFFDTENMINMDFLKDTIHDVAGIQAKNLVNLNPPTVWWSVYDKSFGVDSEATFSI
jgi:hypothetical protein